MSAASGRPNIVFVLTDDLSRDLVRFMPHVLALRRRGLTFSNYTVTDSLCCPSRASILTGRFPHNTAIFTNHPETGGFPVFHARGEERETFATALQAAGYRTAMMGKYLNGYLPADTQGGATPYVPPGWTEWDVAGNGYPEFDYRLNENGRVVAYGSRPRAYLTDVLSRKGATFIRSAAAAGAPFLLEVATFAPHGPFRPAPRDVHAFPGLRAPRGPAFDRLPTHPPRWLAGHPPLRLRQMRKIDRAFRKRAQAVRAVDALIGNLERTLARAGVAKNTYVVFSSDNGFHMGQHSLAPGKLTAFDTDIHVPLIVAGPAVRPSSTSPALAENIDLAPTFEALAGVSDAGRHDGRSLAGLLHGGPASSWRTAALVEHYGPDRDPVDPDFPGAGSGNPTSYEAIRTAGATYVEYADGEIEYYDHVRDPYELHNASTELAQPRRAALHARLAALEACAGAASCRAAGGGG